MAVLAVAPSAAWQAGDTLPAEPRRSPGQAAKGQGVTEMGDSSLHSDRYLLVLTPT